MSDDFQLEEAINNYLEIAVANLGLKGYGSSATDNKNPGSKDGIDLAIEKCKYHPCIKMINEAEKKLSSFRKSAR